MNTAPRGGVSADDVCDAANDLVAHGINPTQVLVRERLGRGSFSVISPLLRQWREKQRACAETQLPESVNEELVRFGKSLWRCAVEAAEHQMLAEHSQWEQEKNLLMLELGDFREAVQLLEQEAEKRNDQVSDIQQQLTQSRVRCEELESQISAIERNYQDKIIDNEQSIENVRSYIAKNMEPLRHENECLKAENKRLAEEVRLLRQGCNR